VFALDLAENPAVEAWKRRLLAGGGAEVEQALERALPFRRFISAELAAKGLPPELVYLPVLESHYRVEALSRSGACGLWQIMANTAGPLGLVVDRWVDERRDFWKSTEAAARKLVENYAYFSDWDLALAAYNCGVGKLSRTVRSSGIRDFWKLREEGLLPRETAEYVPKFHALVAICSDPLRYGLKIGWEQSPAWQRLALRRSVELALLAEQTDLSLELLETANAELKTPITPPRSGSEAQSGCGDEQAGYLIKVPAEALQRVRLVVEDPEKQLLRYSYHSIHSGDTLYALSGYYDVSVALLLEANPGLDPRRLRIGGNLRIPLFAGRELKVQPEQTISPQSLASFTGLYTVQRGDTLWDIARRHGTTPEALALANNRGLDDLLKAGETLKVPLDSYKRQGGQL